MCVGRLPDRGLAINTAWQCIIRHKVHNFQTKCSITTLQTTYRRLPQPTLANKLAIKGPVSAMQRSNERSNANVRDCNQCSPLAATDFAEELTRQGQHPSVANLNGRQNDEPPLVFGATGSLPPSATMGPTVSQLLGLPGEGADVTFGHTLNSTSGLGQPNWSQANQLPGILTSTGFQTNPLGTFDAALLQGRRTIDEMWRAQSQLGTVPYTGTPLNLTRRQGFLDPSPFPPPFASHSFANETTPPMDTLSRLRRELELSNSVSSGPASHTTDISDALAGRSTNFPHTFSDVPSSGLGQLSMAQLNAGSTPNSEALLARDSLLRGNTTLLAPHHSEIRYQQVPNSSFNDFAQQAPASHYNWNRATLNQQYPKASFAQPLDRAEATRFLASRGMSASRVGIPLAWSESGDEESKHSQRLQTGAETKANDPYQHCASWDELLTGDAFSVAEFRGVVSDLYLATMAQVRPCVLSDTDRVGLYETRDIGFPGVCCRHCGGMPGVGRFFPNSLTNLTSGALCASIVKHIGTECRRCPVQVRGGIRRLELQEGMTPSNYPHGSRRLFLVHVWNLIQRGQRDEGGVASLTGIDDGSTTRQVIPTNPSVSDQLHNMEAFIPWDLLWAMSELVHPEDRHLVPDSICAAMAQTKRCQVTNEDRVGRVKNHKLGSIGICCKHCGGKAGAYGRYFPSNLQTMAQVEVTNQIVRHLTQKCLVCPPAIRTAILQLQQWEATQVHRRYPSRMVFFRRVWHRLRYATGNESTALDNASINEDSKPRAKVVGAASLTADEIQWEHLVSTNSSSLVTMVDRGYVSDTQFTALAQMEPCTLSEDDRIGYHKNRALGCVGLRCRFCHGKPGFGRYFPDGVRNLEKTCARETMVSHIALFCPLCPDDVRNALLSLQRIESSNDGSASVRPYGAGKVFYRRIWERLNSESLKGIDHGKLAGTTLGSSILPAVQKDEDGSFGAKESDSIVSDGPSDHDEPTRRKRSRPSTDGE